MPQSLIPPRGGPHPPSAPRGGSYETIRLAPSLNYESEPVPQQMEGLPPQSRQESTVAVWCALLLFACAVVFTLVILRGLF